MARSWHGRRGPACQPLRRWAPIAALEFEDYPFAYWA